MPIDQIPHHQLAGFLRLLSLSKKISPASLTKELDLTHAEASKIIENFLKLDNFLIEKEKTLCCISPLKLLDSSSIEEEINSLNQQNKNLIYAHHIVSESTNTVAAKLLNHSESSVLVSSDFQTKGKGQRGKHWIANPGSSLLFSVGLKAIKKEYFQRNLSLCIGVIIHKYLASIGASNIYLKWPNDIYFGERKLCGILVENTFYEDTNNCVVGIGINKHPFKLGQEQVAGINELLVDGFSSEKIVSDLTKEIITLNSKNEWTSFAGLCGYFNRYDFLKNKTIKITTGSEKLQGKAIGVNEEGELLLFSEGIEKKFASGSVDIIPI